LGWFKLADELVSASPRTGWIDSLRGIAVLLVVLTHVFSLLFNDGLIPPEVQFVFALDLFFSPYRMPLLMFLSGFFVAGSFQKGPKKYFSGKTRYVVWPYLIWTLVIAVQSSDWDALSRFETLKMPYSSLWFLWYLTVYYLLFAFLTNLNSLVISLAALVLSAVPYGSDLVLINHLLHFFVFLWQVPGYFESFLFCCHV
jgi:fucose 4-O-acetylase-like acetyltransferase